MPTGFNKGRRIRPRGSAKNATRKNRNRKIFRKKSAVSQAKQLVQVNRRIDRVLDSQPRCRVGLYHGHYNDALIDDVVSFMPCATAGSEAGQGAWGKWGPNSQSAATDYVFNTNKARVGRVYVKAQITTGTEGSPLRISVFHVKLNPDTAIQTVAECGNNLKGSSFTASNGYFVRGLGAGHGAASTYGSVVLNPDKFITKKQWAFTIGNTIPQTDGVNYTVANLNNCIKNIEFNFPCNYQLGKSDGSDKWVDSTPDDLNPNLNNYLLIFTDNLSDIEGSPSIRTMATTIVTAVPDS